MIKENMSLESTSKGLSRRGPRFFAGGMDPNDFLKVINDVEVWDDWVSGVAKYADERKVLADKALKNGNVISAGEYYVEAGIYYHFSVLGYFEDLNRKKLMKKKSVETYELRMNCVKPAIRRLDIPYDGITLSAHLRVPENDLDSSYPLVVLIPGVDSTKEEYFNFSEVLLKRGLATLAFEGLGQGETRQFRAMTEDYELAFSKAIDYIQDIPNIDSKRIAVYGRSMGGHLAPRVAAFDKRISAEW